MATSEPFLTQRFDVNESIGSFLGVVGLVYALIFAQQYGDAKERLAEIQQGLTVEAGGVHICMQLVRTLDGDLSGKVHVLVLLRSYVEDLGLQLERLAEGRPCRCCCQGEPEAEGDDSSYQPIDSLYSCIPILARLCSDGDGDTVDQLLLERTLDIINQVVQARHQRLSSTKRRIGKYIWGFLVLLAFTTYLGVLLIQSGSQMLNAIYCLLSVMSMTASFVILADMEQPFAGFVSVDMSMFWNIRRDIRLVLTATQKEAQHQRRVARGSGRTLSRSSSGQERESSSRKKNQSMATLNSEASVERASAQLAMLSKSHRGSGHRRSSLSAIFGLGSASSARADEVVVDVDMSPSPRGDTPSSMRRSRSTKPSQARPNLLGLGTSAGRNSFDAKALSSDAARRGSFSDFHFRRASPGATPGSTRGTRSPAVQRP